MVMRVGEDGGKKGDDGSSGCDGVLVLPRAGGQQCRLSQPIATV